MRWLFEPRKENDMNGISQCAVFALSALAVLPALGLLKGISPVLSPELLKVLA
jgi:hypothetical protein